MKQKLTKITPRPRKIYEPPKGYAQMLTLWKNYPMNVVFLQPAYGDAGYDFFSTVLANTYYMEIAHQRKYEECYLKMKYKKDMNIYEQNVFFDTPSSAACHYNEFRGVLSIDLSDWPGLEHSAAFTRFLSFVSNNKENIHYLFSIQTDDISKAETLIHMITQIIPVTTLHMEMPETRYLTNFILASLKEMHFSYSEDFPEFLEKYIDDIKQHDFVTYDTMQTIINQLILFADIKEGNMTITPDYFTKIINKSTHQSSKMALHKIGF